MWALIRHVWKGSINTCKKQIDELKESLELRREQVQEGETDNEVRWPKPSTL